MSGFTEDPKAKRELENAVGKRVLAVECPVRNRTGDICRECERVRKLWKEGTADSENEARKRQAKDSYFLNVQLRNGDFTALKIGKKVAKSLKTKLERYKDKTGAAFGFANIDDAGQWLAINKSGESPNFEYELEVLGETADSVDAAKVKALPSLNNLTEDFNNGVLPLMDISALSSGDGLEFRMVPIPTTEGKATEMVYRYYHWMCNESDILGGADVNEVVETGTSPPKDFSEYMTVNAQEEEEKEEQEVRRYTLETAPKCFGYFDATDDCLEEDCSDIVEQCAAKAGYVYVEGDLANPSRWVHIPKKKKMKA